MEGKRNQKARVIVDVVVVVVVVVRGDDGLARKTRCRRDDPRIDIAFGTLAIWWLVRTEGGVGCGTGYGSVVEMRVELQRC